MATERDAMALRLISMRELAPRYDGFIVDLWGVIHDGIAPLHSALECLEALKEAGKRIVLLSNAPRRADDVARRITALGVPSGLYDHVMSSGEEAWQHLHRRDDPFYSALGWRCLHIGSERDMEIRLGLGLDFVDTAEEAEFILNTGPAGWEDCIADYEAALRAALNRDIPMVCANPDLVVMHGGRLALCAGALAKWYEEAGGRVRWHGKPFRSVYDTCLKLLGIEDRSRVFAVGDSLRTDIAGAAGAGIDSLFIAGGIHAEEFGGGERALDFARVEAVLRAGSCQPVGVAWNFCW
ncbi:MAG TPA: TIGR01459 family HAD-type hydrolase [Stellaceae bacterium]|jgi:HAD superfamily hydrolase (TIGR01459 family)|nr:TIGR01459 family HAD-type hydrolase [Stellaceae bacterium]